MGYFCFMFFEYCELRHTTPSHDIICQHYNSKYTILHAANQLHIRGTNEDVTPEYFTQSKQTNYFKRMSLVDYSFILHIHFQTLKQKNKKDVVRPVWSYLCTYCYTCCFFNRIISIILSGIKQGHVSSHCFVSMVLTIMKQWGWVIEQAFGKINQNIYNFFHLDSLSLYSWRSKTDLS